MRYRFRELEDIYVRNGGSPRYAPVMAAIALAESRGNPVARHVNKDGSVDYGLWQINSSNLSNAQIKTIYNVNNNAKEAIRLAEHSGKGLRNWTVFLTGAFKRFLPTKTQHSRPKNYGVFSQENYAGTDQGVDFRGAGPIPSLGPAVVTDVGRASIIEGQKVWYVVYRLLSGPYKGHFVYVAENFVPSVRPGQRLQQGQSVGRALGKYPYIEIGFNKTGKGWNPVASLYPNPHGAKPAGEKMLQYIQGLTGMHGGGGGFVSTATGVGKDILTGVSDAANPFNLLSSGADAAGNALGIHPERWVQQALMKAVDALAIAGGGFVFLSGVILIAADIGLSSRATSTAEKLYITRAVGKIPKSRTATSRPSTQTDDSRAARERRAEETHQARLKLTQARTTEARTRQKNRRRTRKEQEDAEKKAYYRGATDAASPTMTKIRRSKKRGS